MHRKPPTRVSKVAVWVAALAIFGAPALASVAADAVTHTTPGDQLTAAQR